MILEVYTKDKEYLGKIVDIIFYCSNDVYIVKVMIQIKNYLFLQ